MLIRVPVGDLVLLKGKRAGSSPERRQPILRDVWASGALFVRNNTPTLPTKELNSRRFNRAPRSRADVARLPVISARRINLLRRNRRIWAMAAVDHEEACRWPRPHGRSTSESGRNHRSKNALLLNHLVGT